MENTTTPLTRQQVREICIETFAQCMMTFASTISPPAITYQPGNVTVDVDYIDRLKAILTIAPTATPQENPDQAQTTDQHN
jgi:hypothetical protein